MMTEESTGDSAGPDNGDTAALEARLVDLYDTDGSLRVMLAGMRALTTSPIARLAMRRAKLDPDEWERRIRQHDETVALVAQGVRQFTALGWTPSSRTPVSGLQRAFVVLAESGDVREAECAFADAWNEGALSGASAINYVQTLGVPSEEYNALFRERHRLLFKAWKHHRSGAYEASVPIVYAQVEGICYDVTGKPFFSRRSNVEPVDNETLAGLDEALPVARQWFSQSVDQTSTDGLGSRHGVLHGRELRYDNYVLSTKALVLLLAVVEWARPIAGRRAEKLDAERSLRYAGSDAVDEHGRRLDRREFKETMDSLRWLATCQTGHYRSGRRYRSDLLTHCSPRFMALGLPPDHGMTMQVSDDAQSWFASRPTPSGLVFAMGANASAQAPKYPGEVPMEWHYEGEDTPDGPPGDDPRWGTDPFAITGNW